jgi:hypothetical protein
MPQVLQWDSQSSKTDAKKGHERYRNDADDLNWIVTTSSRTSE